MNYETLSDLRWTLIKEFDCNKVYGMTVHNSTSVLIRWEHNYTLDEKDCQEFNSPMTSASLNKPVSVEFCILIDELDELCK